MKTIKIGELEVKVCETIQDIPVERWTAVKEWLLWQESGFDIPTLPDLAKKMSQEFDNNSPSGMYKAFHDDMQRIEKIKQRTDADQMIFALITLEKDEDKMVTDHTFLKEKIHRFAKEGLTQGTVQKHNVAFLKELIMR
jgi:hypothetical protein